ncbi:ATP-binding cassette domain-containing protein [Roseobacter litoralis]|uniref:ABC transporter ATP-binding protein n=1 Tax=Roseobacter litoralis (strain ATCC 49566 / DSM 6996 / JCM 21268 / NBRC 15278 / OCh 149) TaxID=391595 RepID=F7ZAE6_ROSLO|nr:ATP-binding cassette domain-containing protein [Roseobacter litoralis]AEI92946.1 putative ABC transporter ATP-binding protein [Roseobacter litoralis Och 149]
MTITATGLSVIRSGRTILHPTDIVIRPGERVGLVGASGSGKSTLGHVLIDNLRAEGVSVAHVPQSPDEALDPLRSMAFHWREAERALELSADPIRQQMLFNALHIEGGDLRKRPWGWSRGMQQRFVIAMALIGTPDLLVMDEPTSALDPVVAAGTMDLLDAYLKDRQTALLLITHDLGLAARRVHRLMVMDDGKIVEDAPTERFLMAPKTQAAKALCAHRNWLELPC